MRTDPRAACANELQRLGWAVVHDLVTHPLMALTGWCRASLRLHDWTSHRAWPRSASVAYHATIVLHERFGPLTITEVPPAGFYSVLHGRFSHAVVVKAASVADAVRQAEDWFATLVELIPHSAASEDEIRLARGRWRP